MPDPFVPFHWTILRVGSLRECLDAWQASPLYGQIDAALRNASSVVIDELGSNFLRFSGPHAKEMKLELSFDGAELKMRFDDDGAAFNPSSAAPPPRGHVGLLPVGGRGLHMVRRSMDSWDYQREKNRNLNVLAKRVKKPEDDKAGSPADSQP